MRAVSGCCRHYDYDGAPKCKAGLDIRKVHGNVLACISLPKTECERRAVFTAEEVAEASAKSEAAFELFAKVLTLIGPGDPGDAGEVLCPKCEEGTISYAFARCNGHLHARCSTVDCFGVIQ